MKPIVVDNWRDFSRIMIETKDLDPTYPVLKGLFETHDDDWCGRFMLHYVWFYNLRDAYNVAGETTNDTFWDRCRTDGLGTAVKRRGARRHFRGATAIKGIHNMEAKRLTPWEIIQDIYRASYSQMVANVRVNYEGTQLGSYYTWKIMDWYDICLGWPVYMSVDDAVKYMPDVPKEAAVDFFPEWNLKHTVEVVLDHVASLNHPVKAGHKCGLGEVETVICTLKGYLKTKAHWIGEDIADAHALLGDLPAVKPFIPALIPVGAYIRGEYRHVS